MPITVPTDISGCYCWYNAGAITGVTNGHLIQTWRDSSASGNHLSGGIFDHGPPQVNYTSYQPVYYTNVINGQPAAWFESGSGSFMGSTSALSQSLKVTNGVWFSVYKTAATGIQSIFSQEFATPNGFFPTLVHGLTNPTGWSFVTNNGVGGGTQSVTTNAVISPTGEFLIRCDRRNSGFQQFIRSGAAFASGLTNASATVAVAGNSIYLGSSTNFGPVSGSGDPFKGHIAEIIGYNRGLSNAEVNDVTNYLMFKYFINSSTATLYTNANPPTASSSISLYVQGDATASSVTPLFLLQAGPVTNQIPLYVATTLAASSSKTLYLHSPSSINNNFSLYLSCAGMSSGNTTLYMGSSLTQTSGAMLYTGSAVTLANTSNLYLLNLGHASSTLPLYVGVTSRGSGFATLYMSGVGHSTAAGNLFVKQIPRPTGSKATTLFIPVNTTTSIGGGGIVGAGSFYKSSTLYTKSILSNHMSLYLKGQPSAEEHTSVPLFLKVRDTTSIIYNAATDTTLYLQQSNQVTTLPARLFIGGAGFNGSNDGSPGALIGQGGMVLFLERPTHDTVSMFIKSVGTVTSSMSMYIKSAVHGSPSLYLLGGGIHQTGAFTLYLPTPSSVFNSVNLCIPKTYGDAPNNSPLYVHGF